MEIYFTLVSKGQVLPFEIKFNKASTFVSNGTEKKRKVNVENIVSC